MAESNHIRDAVDAAKGIVEAVPVYQDLVQPAAREVGTALQTVAKTIHVALAPVSALVWGYDKIRDFVSTSVAAKLANVPTNDIESPPPNVAGPALEALRYTGHEESLSEMYASLLAASMDKVTVGLAHPGFVDIIKQLTPDEAKIVHRLATPGLFPVLSVRRVHREPKLPEEQGYRNWLTNFSLLPFEAGCQIPENGPAYLDDLCRLGLISILENKRYSKPDAYSEITQHPTIRDAVADVEKEEHFRAEIVEGCIQITNFGMQFIAACATPHDEARSVKQG